MATQRIERHHWPINDVLDRTDLAALLDEVTQPSGRIGPGRKWHCPMPYHDDHRASVTMFRDRHGHERWRCWSGDHRGDAIDLAVAVTGQDRGEAIEWLAARAGMFPDRPLPAIKPKASPAPDAARVMDPLVARYVHACAQVLQTSTGRPVRDWLNARGIGDDTINANLIGADPGRQMMRRSRGLPYGNGLAATFPVFGPAGNLTYVQARYLDVEGAGRKYDNPAAALAPHPRLGFVVSPNLLHQDTLLVCEGMPDALISAQAGFQAVGLLGAHTPDEAVAARLANRAANLDAKLVLVCDPDPAGRRLADALSPLLERQGHAPTVIVPPNGYDLNDWAQAEIGWAGHLISQLSADSDIASLSASAAAISSDVAL